MWNDLNMHDRHKLIRLAVTNGVYDLDTIHSLYDDVQNTYDKGGPIGRKLIRDINERSAADFVKRLQDRNREYIVNPDNTISTHKLSWATDDHGNAIVYPEVQNTPAGLMDYSYDRNKAFEEALGNKDTLMMSPSQAEWFTTHYKKYYPSFRYDKGGNMKIAPYRDNSSYADRKLYRNVKRDFRKNPEAEYKDYDEYEVRVYNPSLSSDAPNRKERQEAMLERIRQDFPEIQKNDVKKTAFKSNTLGWHNNNTGYMGTEDKRTLFGLQQDYDFVSNIVPYGKLGMDTPENIRRKEELERKNRNTTFDYTNNFDFGGELPTDPNRLPLDTNPIIDRMRVERLARYTAPDSALAQIKKLTDNIRENEFKREFAEWINPTRNTNDYVDIRRTIPVAEARPTFINTYEKGGPKDPPEKSWYNKSWIDILKPIVKNQISEISEPIINNYGNKLKLYNNLDPFGYQEGLSRIIDALVWDEKAQILKDNHYSPTRDRIFAKALGIKDKDLHYPNSEEYNNIEESPYKPTKGNIKSTYYRIKPEYFSINQKEDIIKKLNSYPGNFNKNVVFDYGTPLATFFGKYTVGRGLDPQKGEYISYYDLWDLTPHGIHVPIKDNEYYDRIYLDDYYGVNSRPNSGEYYGKWIPEVTINSDNTSSFDLNGKTYNKDTKGKYEIIPWNKKQKRTAKTTSMFNELDEHQ